MTINRPFDGLSQNAVRFQARARTLARQHPREAIAIGALAFVAAVAIGSIAVVPEPAAAPAPHAAPPAPPPLILKAIAPQDAIKLNSEIPVTSGPNPAAAAFLFKGNEVAKTQALECLASAVYYEAGNQDESGERAVAQVVLNRVRHPAFPNSICGVVYEGSTRPTGCQFTFTCDGSLMREPDADGGRRAWKIAVDALSGYCLCTGWLGPPISCRLCGSEPGLRAWPRTSSSAPKSSIAGQVRGVSLHPSLNPMRAMNRAPKL